MSDVNAKYSPWVLLLAVNQDETLKLLHCYQKLTSERKDKVMIDRVKFCDLLHEWFGMTDEFFMDKGELLRLRTTWNTYGSEIYHQRMELSVTRDSILNNSYPSS